MRAISPSNYDQWAELYDCRQLLQCYSRYGRSLSRRLFAPLESLANRHFAALASSLYALAPRRFLSAPRLLHPCRDTRAMTPVSSELGDSRILAAARTLSTRRTRILGASRLK